MGKSAQGSSIGRNQAKYQVFSYVLSSDDEPYGVAARVIADHCPAVSLEYLQTRLDYWVREGYMRRRKAPVGWDSRKVYRYRLTLRGEAWFKTVVPAFRRDEAAEALKQEVKRRSAAALKAFRERRAERLAAAERQPAGRVSTSAARSLSILPTEDPEAVTEAPEPVAAPSKPVAATSMTTNDAFADMLTEWDDVDPLPDFIVWQISEYGGCRSLRVHDWQGNRFFDRNLHAEVRHSTSVEDSYNARNLYYKFLSLANKRGLKLTPNTPN